MLLRETDVPTPHPFVAAARNPTSAKTSTASSPDSTPSSSAPA